MHLIHLNFEGNKLYFWWLKVLFPYFAYTEITDIFSKILNRSARSEE